jgi:hypothetical protein
LRAKSLRGGRWPETLPSREPVELAPAAKKQAEAAIEELQRAGVTAALDDEGRVRFRSAWAPPLAVRMIIERMGDVIEALLIERRSRANFGS